MPKDPTSVDLTSSGLECTYTKACQIEKDIKSRDRLPLRNGKIDVFAFAAGFALKMLNVRLCVLALPTS